MEDNKKLSAFKALSDKVRFTILEMLIGGELCACKILERLNITQPTLSYHMKILCESGLIEERRDGSWMKYRLRLEAIESACSVLRDIIEKEKASMAEVKSGEKL